MKRRKRQKERMRRKRKRALMKAFCYRHTTPWRGWRSLCTRSESLHTPTHMLINVTAETLLTLHVDYH